MKTPNNQKQKQPKPANAPVHLNFNDLVAIYATK
jgi:hypothetical protein